VTLEVRHLFHPDAMGFDKVPVEERGAPGMVQMMRYVEVSYDTCIVPLWGG
jgi:hypothetical protein